ncbi:hypothetical protein H6F88_32445 [Oculatella sp. FACHB-28]|uniref:hypothetical protein n=1 Tax=Cyanophyceae TaxID=3028117 RepID=UPI0016891A3D|nr:MULTISPECIES: hypothetical protein [Cyanophyceae]MBD2060654.1 hypothetical protein [Oculatella sp. FACHB-28]MBD2068917.1 hypothetical protein [Leptolyngbya sp. FACHB-671]
MPQCTAKSKQTGERCQRPAISGRNVCYHHGGNTPVGRALPQTKTGRYSRHIPDRLIEQYEASANDEELLSLREEVQLIDARMIDMLKRVEGGDSEEIWKRLKAEFQTFEDAMKQNDQGAVTAALAEVRRLIKRGLGDYAAWNEVKALMEQRRRLVESERKRLLDMQQFITAEKALLLISSLTEVIKKHVKDRAALAAISTEFIRLTGSPNSGEPSE